MTWLAAALREFTSAFAAVTGDASAIDRLDSSESGFWRSFTAVLPIVPIYLYAATAAGSAETPLAWYALSLLAQWLVWPCAVALVARPLGWSRSYARYIVAYNWSSLWVMLALIPPVILAGLGMAGPVMNLIALASFVLALWMRWFVARHGLGVAGEVAAALVLADLLVGVLVDGALT
jgi:hypothetical protein